MKGNEKNKSLFFLFVLLFASAFPLTAGISFHSPDLNENDEVLYTVYHDIQGTEAYSTLFYAKIANGKPSAEPVPLTCYPEQFDYLKESNSLRISNRYGTAFYSFDTNKLVWTKRTDSIPADHGMLSPVSLSPDGRYSCSIERTDTAAGNLVLKDLDSGRNFVLAEQVQFSYYSVPVKWSPDSKTLLYENDNTVFFCTPEVVFSDMDIPSRFRKIGRGKINSVCWADDKNFIYIDNDLIYEIDSRELYTLGLYSNFISSGTAEGRLPFLYDALTDNFFVNKDASRIVIIQSGSMISYFQTVPGYSYIKPIYSQPYIGADGTVTSFNVVWTEKDPLLWVDSILLDSGKKNAAVYTMNDSLSNVLSAGDSQYPCVSPDGSRTAFTTGSSVYVYSTAPWQRIASVSGENVVSLSWKDNTSLCIGGSKTVQVWNTVTDTKTLLFLSSADRGFWAADDGAIYAVSSVYTGEKKDTLKNAVYLYDKPSGGWSYRADGNEKNAKNQNGRYRIFTAMTSNSDYDNALYIRTLAGNAVTLPMYDESVVKKVPGRKAVLVFDALDSDAGLGHILSVLMDYKIKATFFINGEFIQRYPKEAKQIAVSGHECASLFFTTEKLDGNGFQIDEDFIRRGLARTEDEFYEATGYELVPFWHAPYYYASPAVIQYGKNAGYTYVNASEPSYDFVTMNDSVKGKATYYSSGELINRYMKQLASASADAILVLPVTVGIEYGKRDDYLYDRLDVLIDSILDAGYTIVTYQGALR